MSRVYLQKSCPIPHPSHLVDELCCDGGIHACLLVVEQLLDVVLVDANLVVALHDLVVRQLHLSLLQRNKRLVNAP